MTDLWTVAINGQGLVSERLSRTAAQALCDELTSSGRSRELITVIPHSEALAQYEAESDGIKEYMASPEFKWLAELFEFEYCAECGGDDLHHTVARDMFGHRHAACTFPPDVDGRPHPVILRYRERQGTPWQPDGTTL